MIVAELLGTMTVAGRGELYGTLSADGEGLGGTATIDGSLAAFIYRTAGPVQRVGIEIYVGGVQVPPTELLGAVTADLSMSSHSQTASFTLALRTPDGPLGNPLANHGPAFGLAAVDIYGLLLTSSGERRIPILLGGVPHSISRKSQGGRQEVYSILDAMGRVDHLTVTLAIPAGSGLTRDVIMQRVASQIGLTSIQLATCGPVFRIVEYVDADPLRAMETLMDVEGRAVFLTAEGVLVNPLWEIEDGERPVWTFTETDILAGSIEGDPPTEVVTDITLTSTAQVLRTPAEQVGSQPQKTEVTIEALYQPLSVAYVQNGPCTVSALSPVPYSPQIIPISKTVATTEQRGGVTVTEETITEGYRITEATRYVFAGSGVRNCITPVYLLPGADPAGNGTEAAYLEQNEAWRQVKKTVAHHYYDDPAFLGPPSTPGSAQAPWGNHFLGSPQSTGRLLGQITDTWDWYLVGHALKQAVPGTTWEAIDPIVGVEVRGDGRGASASEESYMVTAREVQVIEATPAGYLRSTAVYIFGWSTGTGNAYWYQGSGPAALAAETFQLLKKVTTAYVPVTGDESSYLQVETSVDYTGNASPVTKTTRNVGAPPAVEVLPSSLPDPSIFDTPEQAKAAMIARNTETRTIIARVTAPELEEIHPRRIVKTTAGDAETVDELAALGRRTINLSAANTVTFAIPFNPAVRLAQVIRVVDRPMGIDSAGKAETIRHSVARQGGATTTVTILEIPSTSAG